MNDEFFAPAPGSISFPVVEEDILGFWKKHLRLQEKS